MRVTFYPRTLAAGDPVGRDVPWPDLAANLQRFRPLRGDKDFRLHHAPLWSPVELKVPHRAAPNVAIVTALVLDYDDDAALTLDDALDRWQGYERVGYTTWSHGPDAPRCRVVLPLDRAIPARWWSGLYRSMLEGQGQDADPKCTDPCRAYYLPCIGHGGPHEARRERGEWLDLYDEAQALAEAEAREKAERQAERERRAAQMRAELAQAADAAPAMRRLLAIDPDARRRLADRVGADICTDGTGSEVARRATCPACGRPDVWWVLARGWARCNHVNSCGWQGTLYDYARVMG